MRIGEGVGQRHIEQRQQLGDQDKRRNMWALYTRKVNKTQVTAAPMGRAISDEVKEQRQEVESGRRWKQYKRPYEQRDKNWIEK